MTLKAVYFHSRVIMTRPAKMLGAFYGYRFFICTRHGMTGNAAYQTESLGAFALVYGVIPVMQDNLHVVGPHIGRIQNAFVALALGDVRERYPAFCHHRTAYGEQKKEQDWGKGLQHPVILRAPFGYNRTGTRQRKSGNQYIWNKPYLRSAPWWTGLS